MNKTEAESLVGKTLLCSTDYYGKYLGKCLRIISRPRRPWRAVVEILAVTEYPQSGLSEYSARYLLRKPYGFGERREFGHSSVQLYDGTVPDYKESVVTALTEKIAQIRRSIEHARQLGIGYELESRELQVMVETLAELKKGRQTDTRPKSESG